MGILNVTPDSFSDGGSYQQLDAVLHRVETMIAEGAHIIDVGGESTRPGYTMISDNEEIARVAPVVEAITNRFDIPISVDTYKATVAKAALEAGAHMINDIWGLQYPDEESPHAMAQVIARANAACCLMHNKTEAVYDDFLSECFAFLKNSATIAVDAGVDKTKIMLDPGVGFGKTYAHNMLVMQQLKAFHQL